MAITSTVAAAVKGRALFEIHCAPCHGARGQGSYFGPSLRAPPIAGVSAAKVVDQIQSGGENMPAFSVASLPSGALEELGMYVHEGLSNPARVVGPRALDPLAIGAIVWIALAILAGGLAALFAEGRN